ncbi:hypothetical protein CAEBREN_18740 [Caenorhabditis brenneri]|uniref:Serpentine Receptor, class Z n=1 Tax=Caenorhabditis brenneri TaxID=135651 RepID=G0N1Z5_CAEBE|nr:hypothetical protein CAEBREN_18740 [Caenorhabditis brenneri]
MNNNNFNANYSIFSYFDEFNSKSPGNIWVTILITCFLILCFILLLMIYPYYLHVYRVNRERDKSIAVFQIINHFHTFIKSVYWMLCLMIFCGLLYFITENLVPQFLNLVKLFAAFFFYSCLVVTEVNHTLMSLLAVQRCLLYFFPSTEKFMNFKPKTMKCIIWFAYGLSISHSLITFVTVLLESRYVNSHDIFFAKTATYYPIYYLSLNILVILSALLYVPLIISTKKMSHLASSQQNQPQKYISLQLGTILTLKLIYLPMIVFNFRTLLLLTLSMKFIDSITTPLIIQLSYLLCNKRNTTTLLSSLSGRSALRSIYCPCFESAQIEAITRNSNGVSSTVASRSFQ